MSIPLVTDHFDYLLKLVVVGDSGVGKTNLLSRFSTNQFTHQSKPTIGVEFATKSIKIDNNNIKVQIWDTAGQQRFRAITGAYYKGATGALLVFDLTRRSTFQNLSKWLKQLRQNAQLGIVIVLVGNKSDLKTNKNVLDDQIAQFATDNNLFYMETSAKQLVNVQKAFMSVIQQIYEQMKKNSHRTNLTQKPILIKRQEQINHHQSIKLKQKNKRLKTQKKKCCQ